MAAKRRKRRKNSGFFLRILRLFAAMILFDPLESGDSEGSVAAVQDARARTEVHGPRPS